MPCSFKKLNSVFHGGREGSLSSKKIIDWTGECMHACLELLLRRQSGDSNYLKKKKEWKEGLAWAGKVFALVELSC